MMRRIRPILALFFRSLREDTRARLPTILRFIVVAVILLILWENQRSFGYSSAPGREFFTYVMLLNLGVIGVAALSIFPSAIAEEKEDETLTLLRMTNLNPLAILFGKSTSRFASALLLLAVQVPFTLLAITLGGISMEQVWKAYAILAVTTFFLCNLALLASVICRTTLRAGFMTGAFGMLVYVGLPLAYAASEMRHQLPRTGFGTAGFVPDFWDSVLIGGLHMNPLWALMTLLQGRGMMEECVGEHVAINLVAGTILFLVSLLLFDRYCARLVDVAPKPKRKREGKRHRWGWVTRTWPVVPLAWKDFHFMVGGRLGFYVRLGCAIAITIVVPIISASPRRSYTIRLEELGFVMVVVAGWCAALELLLLAGRIFGVERRSQTLSGLVSLPWSKGRIIWQKVLGCLPALAPWFILAAGGALFAWDEISREFAREVHQTYAWTLADHADDLLMMAYVTLQAVWLVLLVVWLSLRMRRGALPAAIALCAVWNIVFGVCMDAAPRKDELIGLTVGVLLTLLFVVLAGRGIYSGISSAASEES